MKRNIKLNYWFQWFFAFGITNMWMLYLGYKGMSLLQIGIMESIFHIASFSFEVPSGAIADLFGRKKTIILGRIAAIIGYGIMLFSHSFLLLSLGFVFSALSYALTSGSNEAIVYDSLKQLKEEGNYIDVISNMRIIDEIAYNAGLILAGVILDIYFEGVYIIGIVFAIIAIGFAVFMKEPLPQKKERQTFKDYFEIFKIAFTILKNDLDLLYLMIYCGILQACVATFYFYFQPYLQNIGYLGREISILIFISGIVQTASIKLASIMTKRFNSRLMLSIVGIVVAILLMATSFITSYVLLIIFIAINALGSFSNPINDTEMQKKIPSEQRATLISISSMFYSIVMIIFFPVVGYLGDTIGIQYAFIVVGMGFALLVYGLRKVLKSK